MIKNFVYNNAFIGCNISQFFFVINNCFAYIITFFIVFIRLRYFVIKIIIDNFDIEFDVIKVQSIRYENNLMLLFKSFILRVYRFEFNHLNKSICFEIL